MTDTTEEVRVPAGTPEEFRADIELAIHAEVQPQELRALRQQYQQDGREPIRAAAENFIADDVENRDAYLDAMADAFEAALGDE